MKSIQFWLTTLVLFMLFAVGCTDAEKESQRQENAKKVGAAWGLYSKGNQYLHGHDRLQDIGEAVKCFRESANMGYAPSQAKLAAFYTTGLEDHVPKDPVEAYAWAAVSATKYPEAQDLRDGLKAELNAHQLSEGKKRAEQIFETFGCWYSSDEVFSE